MGLLGDMPGVTPSVIDHVVACDIDTWDEYVDVGEQFGFEPEGALG